MAHNPLVPFVGDFTFQKYSRTSSSMLLSSLLWAYRRCSRDDICMLILRSGLLALTSGRVMPQQHFDVSYVAEVIERRWRWTVYRWMAGAGRWFLAEWFQLINSLLVRVEQGSLDSYYNCQSSNIISVLSQKSTISEDETRPLWLRFRLRAMSSKSGSRCGHSSVNLSIFEQCMATCHNSND